MADNRQKRFWTLGMLITLYAMLVTIIVLDQGIDILGSAILYTPVVMAIIIPPIWIAVGLVRSVVQITRDALRSGAIDLNADLDSAETPDPYENDDATLLELRERRRDQKQTRQDRTRNQPVFSRSYI